MVTFWTWRMLTTGFFPGVIRLKRVPALIIGLAPPVMGLILILQATPADLSGRGRIWVQARELLLQTSPIHGLGITNWEGYIRVGLLPDHFTHSTYLTILFAGGLIGYVLVSLLFVAIFFTCQGSGWRDQGSRLVPLLFLNLYGLTEVIWNPLSVDTFSWLTLPILAMATARIVSRPIKTVPSSGDAMLIGESNDERVRPGGA
jgi:O-antigen ligase